MRKIMGLSNITDIDNFLELIKTFFHYFLFSCKSYSSVHFSEETLASIPPVFYYRP